MTQFQYSHALRRTWIVVAMVIPLVLLLAVLAFSSPPDEEARRNLRQNTLPFIFFSSLWLVTVAVSPFMNARKQFAAGSLLREPTILTFTNEQISSASASASWSMAWSQLKTIRETRSLFLLYHGPNTAIIVPKRLFSSQVELDRWLALVTSCARHCKVEKPGFVGQFL